jgi:purine catabolism regulator
VLEAVHRMAGGLVVLEGADHRPLDFRGGAGGADQLDNWQARSTRIHVAGRTGWDERNGWLATRLGTRDQAWGRLVITAETRPSERMIAIAERAAAALALHRLHDRDRGNLIRRTHHELLAGLQGDPHSPDVLRRCEVAGFSVRGRAFVGLVVRPRGLHRSGDPVDELVAAVLAAAESVRAQALVTESEHDIVALLSLPPSGRVDAVVDRFAQRVADRHDVVIAAGRVAVDREDVDRTVREAQQVGDAIGAGRAAEHAVHRLEDTHLRGLLALLGDDDRLALYVDRELAALRDHDDLLDAVRALLEHPTSKTDAAASLHLSRAAFYDRLARAERLLAADLDEADTRVSLHVALLADRLRSARPATPTG